MTIRKRMMSVLIAFALIIAMIPFTAMNAYADGEGIKVDKNTIHLIGSTWTWEKPSIGDGQYAEYYVVSLYEGRDTDSGKLINSKSGLFGSSTSNKAEWDTSGDLKDDGKYFIEIQAASDKGGTLGDSVYSIVYEYELTNIGKPDSLEWDESTETKVKWGTKLLTPNEAIAVVSLYKRLSATKTEFVNKVSVSAKTKSYDFIDSMEDHNTYFFTVKFQYEDLGIIDKSKESVEVTSKEKKYHLLVLNAPKLSYTEGYGFRWNKVENATGYIMTVNRVGSSTKKEIKLASDETFLTLNDSRLNSVFNDGNKYTVEMISVGDQYTSLNSAEPSSVEITYKSPEFADGVYVGKLQISDTTCDDIVAALKDIGEDASGKATYSKGTKTLTLENFSYNGAGGGSGSRAAAIQLQNGSKIVVIGNNKLNCTAKDGAGVVGDVTLTGSGSLSVAANHCGFTSSVSIEGPTVIVSANKYGFSSVDGTLTMTNGALTVTTPESGGVAVHRNMKADINQTLVYIAGLSPSENRVRELPAKNGNFAPYSYMNIAASTGFGGKATVTMDKDSFVYNDSVQVPNVTVKIGSKTLLEDREYTVAYYSDAVCTKSIKQADIEDAGTYFIKISGKGEYNGYIIRSFIIKKFDPKVINGSTFIYNGQTKTGNVVFKGAHSKTLMSEKISERYPGTYTVIYPGDKNYNSAKGTWKIIVKNTKITKMSKQKKGFTVKVKKESPNYISGYQLRYSRNANMINSRIVTIGSKYTSVKKTVKKLKSKKKYYVQVRTYKNVSGYRYYSAWSGKKAITTK